MTEDNSLNEFFEKAYAMAYGEIPFEPHGLKIGTIYRKPLGNYSKCPRCGYWAFDGKECRDCGYTK